MHVDNPSTLRQIIFASVYLPNDIPNYWRLVAEFAAHGSKDKALHYIKQYKHLWKICNIWINMHL